MPVRLWVLAVATCIFASLPSAQSAGPESFPHDYPGKPQGDYSPAWQTCNETSYLRIPSHF